MNNPKLFKTPIAVASVLLVIGLLCVTNLLYMPFFIPDYSGMDYGFALVFLGLFIIITAIVIFYYYGRLNRNFQNMLDGSALLYFVLSKDLYLLFRDKEAKDIKAGNKAVLFIIYVFCIIFGIIFALTIDVMFLLICLGIAVFFTIVYFLVTAFRTQKVKRSQALVCLNEGGVYLFGQMHAWSLPGSHPVSISFDAAENTGLPCRCILITYSALAYPVPRSETVTVPVPPEYYERAVRAVDAFKNAYGI